MQLNQDKPILVTGATGYVASHIIKKLLQRGYKVRGTVRSLANKEKYSYLTELVPEKNANLEFVEADLTNEASWENAVKGVEYVLHIASPASTLVTKDENEVILPAVNGTKYVLNAALKAGVKKVVLTSSGQAIIFGNFDKAVDESYWSKVEICPPYAKSKTLAEKAAWDFYEQHKDQIEVSVINPTLVLGPIHSRHGSQSELLISNLLNSGLPGLLDVTFSVVDVRDVAEAHLLALFNKENTGKRFLICGAQISLKELATNLNDNFGKYGYKVPLNDISVEEAKASGNLAIQKLAPMNGLKFQFSTERSIKELGLKYEDVQNTINDQVISMANIGSIQNLIK